MTKEIVTLDMNRVEGDLELKIEIEAGVITDAWTIGTMYRGFEQILIGRAKNDGLAITPRICGICGTAHLQTSVSSIETAFNLPIAPNGTRVRNICLMSETIQSDVRHTFLMFCVDLCNKAYVNVENYSKVVELFEAFKGRIYRETIEHSKRILEVLALFAGQWPHASFMVPGGVTGMGDRKAVVKALGILDNFIKWYEDSILGCSLDRWLENKSLSDIENWMEEKEEHKNSPVAIFIKFTRDIGFQNLGKGNGNLLSPGMYHDPIKWQPPFEVRNCLRPGGFHNAETGEIEPLDHKNIEEHVKYSWFKDYENGKEGLHPWEGETIPSYSPDSDKYSWAKSPRYKGKVIEVGPLPELVLAGDELIYSLFKEEGTNVFTRQITRFHRPVLNMKMMRESLLEIDKNFSDPFYIQPPEKLEGEGYGMVNAARGFLAHWVKFKDGKIEKYQVVSPTTWNASPRDSKGVKGHWENSIIGTKIADEDNPIEVEHIIRSHDACLVCTVHYLKTDKKKTFGI